MKYWKATTSNGNTYTESDKKNWSEISKDVTQLELHVDGQTITLPKNMKYIQAKTACADIGSQNAEIQSRYIGIKLGNNIVRVRVDEKTNNISIEVD
mgnify:CR=1 FL=1